MITVESIRMPQSTSFSSLISRILEPDPSQRYLLAHLVKWFGRHGLKSILQHWVFASLSLETPCSWR